MQCNAMPFIEFLAQCKQAGVAFEMDDKSLVSFSQLLGKSLKILLLALGAPIPPVALI